MTPIENSIIRAYYQRLTDKIDASDYVKNLGRADLHVHSNYSDAKQSISEIIDYASRIGLDIVAITDHDTIKGALEAQKIVKERKLKLQIIVGEEITCKEGHLIGLFLKKPITSKLGVDEAIREIKKQSGLVLTPHPLYHTRATPRDMPVIDGIGIISLVKHKEDIDAVEVINATPGLGKQNVKAQLVNRSIIFKSETGGSDAHILEAVGQAYTIFEGHTVAELRSALENGQTVAAAKKWKLVTLLKYGYFFIPKGLRLSIYTLIHGRTKKRPQIKI